jgi:hypothetical protein
MNQHFSARAFLPLLGLGLLSTFSCTKETPTPTANLGAGTTQQEAQATPGFVMRSKQYIIIASGDQLPGDIETQTTAANGKVTNHLQGVGIAVATSDDPNFAAKAAKIAGVRSVVHDFTYQGFEPEPSRVAEVASDNVNPPSTGDSNPLYPLQWGATAIEAPEAWNTGNLGQGVLVADLDGIVCARRNCPVFGPGYGLEPRHAHGRHHRRCRQQYWCYWHCAQSKIAVG